MPASTAAKGIKDALLAAQKDIAGLSLTKDSASNYNKFLSLGGLMDAVLPVLNTHGLVLIQTPTVILHEGFAPVPALTTKLIHSASGDVLEDTMALMMDKASPQGQGSGITYAKRYALSAMLAIVADEDDDGQAASTASQSANVVAREVLPGPVAF